ncbi:MAG: hypothetical protein U1F37_21665 [Alphaproteobacteria bacterium]
MLAWPFTLDIERFGWMIPFAVFGLSALQAASSAPPPRWRATRFAGAAGVVVFAVCWAALEFARGQVGNVFAGFPWNLIAISWTAVDEMIQPAAYLGAYGLGFLTVLVAAMPAVLFEPSMRRGARAAWLGGALVLLAALWLGGAQRLAAANGEPVPGVRLRLVRATSRRASNGSRAGASKRSPTTSA